MKFTLNGQFHCPHFLTRLSVANLKACLPHKPKVSIVVGVNVLSRRSALASRGRPAWFSFVSAWQQAISIRMRHIWRDFLGAREQVSANWQVYRLSAAEIAAWSEGRLCGAEMERHFTQLARDLSSAWPADWSASASHSPCYPPQFEAMAAQCQAEKAMLFDCANTPERLLTAMRCADILHGRPGRTERLSSVTAVLLSNPAIQAVFERDHESFISMALGRDQFLLDILGAAKWHGLVERHVPVALLAAKRRSSRQDRQHYLAHRSAQPVRLDDRFGTLFPSPQVMTLIQPIAATGARSLAAQFVDLMQRIVTLAAEPGSSSAPRTQFRNAGKTDANRLLAAIVKDMRADKMHLDTGLKTAVKAAIAEGCLDAALDACDAQDASQNPPTPVVAVSTRV